MSVEYSCLPGSAGAFDAVAGRFFPCVWAEAMLNWTATLQPPTCES